MVYFLPSPLSAHVVGESEWELGDERCAKRSGCARQSLTFARRRRQLGCRSSMVEKAARDCRQQCLQRCTS